MVDLLGLRSWLALALVCWASRSGSISACQPPNPQTRPRTQLAGGPGGDERCGGPPGARPGVAAVVADGGGRQRRELQRHKPNATHTTTHANALHLDGCFPYRPCALRELGGVEDPFAVPIAAQQRAAGCGSGKP